MSASISVRMSKQERDLLKRAADQTHTSLSDFIRSKTLEAAELSLMERRITTISAEDWERAEAWVRVK